jgi:integrase
MVRRQGHKPISKNFKTRAEAKSWAREIETALEKGDTFSLTNKTVADLVDRYLEEVEPIRYEKTVLLWWREQLGKLKLRDFRRAHVVQARKALQKEVVKKGPNKGQTLAPATINRRVALLSRVCSVAVEEWDWLKDNPCHIKSLTENNERNRILAPEERARLMAVLKDHQEAALQGFVLVAESTGMRAGEIRAMRWDDVNHDTGAVEILRSKNGDKRVVFLGTEALQWLRDWRKEHRLRFDGYVFGNATGKAPFDYLRPWKDAKEQAGLEDLRFHDLRHGFVTAALRAGANPVMVQLVSGHRSSAMLKRYAHLVTDVAQQVAKAVDEARAGSDEA